jgi:hypothetical protein
MPKSTSSTKRSQERLAIEIPVTVVTGTAKTEHRATSVDLCPEGLRLQSNASLKKNQRVRLDLGASPVYFVRARVAWVGKPGSPQAGQAGFQFLLPTAKRAGNFDRQ